jgi:hypothetical protein
MNEKFVVDYYNGLTERERRKLIGAIPRSMEYGVTQIYMLLSDAAKDTVRDSFRAHLADHCEPNGAPCLCEPCRSLRHAK